MKLLIFWSIEINLTEINFSPEDKLYDLNIFNSFSNSNILLFKEKLLFSSSFIILFNSNILLFKESLLFSSSFIILFNSNILLFKE